jgi:hypothetical protein
VSDYLTPAEVRARDRDARRAAWIAQCRSAIRDARERRPPDPDPIAVDDPHPSPAPAGTDPMDG